MTYEPGAADIFTTCPPPFSGPAENDPEMVRKELFRLERLRALVREWPEHSIPVIEISELKTILEGE